VRYVGGKGRIARAIVEQIQQHSPDATIAVEPFMGGASVTAELARAFPVVLAADAHPDIAALWSATTYGWTPPATVTEEEYAELRSAAPSPLRGLAGFGGSFGGKWWGGYARGGVMADQTPRDHQAESARAVVRIGEQLRAGAVWVGCRDYRNTPIIPGSVIYCDPPYASTQGYSTGAFDSIDFWAWAEIASDVADVYVSEYRAPSWWRCIWSTEKRQSVTMPAQGRAIRTERLFTLKGAS
jgi:DNA adenine methylase